MFINRLRWPSKFNTDTSSIRRRINHFWQWRGSRGLLFIYSKLLDFNYIEFAYAQLFAYHLKGGFFRGNLNSHTLCAVIYNGLEITHNRPFFPFFQTNDFELNMDVDFIYIKTCLEKIKNSFLTKFHRQKVSYLLV